jgi:hypothetical protein
MSKGWAANSSVKRLSDFWLIIIIVAGHLQAIFFYGATFWVDSEIYVYHSFLFGPLQEARETLADPRIWYAFPSYLHYGEGLIWHFVSKLPLALIWPAMAGFQHVCGILAQAYLFTTLNRIAEGKSRLLLIPCLLMSFFPFYQTMHNCLMTEALAGNMLVLALTAGLRLACCPRKRDYAYLALSSLGVMFRAYLGGLPFIALLILLLFRRISLAGAVKTGALCGLGFLFSPLWFWGVGGELRLVPNQGLHYMWVVSVNAPAVPPAAAAYADTVSWPDEGVKQRLLSGEFSRFDAIAAGEHWHKNGLTRAEAEAESLKIGNLFLDQPGQWKRRITAALICLGVPEAAWLPVSWQHRRQPDRAKMYAHLMEHYKYLSWVAPSEATYKALSSLPYFHDGPEHLLMKEAWRPYLNFTSPERARDILGLSKVPLGLWAALGLGAGIFMFRRGYKLPGALFVGIFLALFFSFYLANMPGIRYSYLALLLYLAAFSTALALPKTKAYQA